MRRVAFYTLGCKLNFSETSTISRMFEDRGYQRVAFQESPDIFVINTCSVTDNADKKCRKIVSEAKTISPHSYVVILGCYAQLKPQEIAEIPGVNAVLGAAEKFRLFEYLENFQQTTCTQVFASEISAANEFNHSYSLNDRTRTFLKVQDGCNYGCSFCTIPLARGKSRSDSVENVLKVAKEIANTEVKEVVLTGVNIGDFGIEDGKRSERFIDLLKELEEVNGIERFRISSIEPNLLTQEIIDFVQCSQKFVPHFHIPLQSGSDNILRLMNRRYRTDLYRHKIESIKEVMPEACIGVDVIVGFPGESEKDFNYTYEFLTQSDVSYLHVFTYSERPNTPAASMEDVVSAGERKRRSKMLRILSEKKRRKFYEDNLGSNAEVLFENDVQDGVMHGYTGNYIRVCTPYDPSLVNSIIPVRLRALNRDGLMDIEQNEMTLA